MLNIWSSSHDDIRFPFQREVETNPEPSSAAGREDALARNAFSGASESLTHSSLRPVDGLSAEQPPQLESSLSSRSLRKTLSHSPPNGFSLSSATEQSDKQKQALAIQAQRKAEAPMTQLKKTPSSTKVNDSQKRIEKSQISGPNLVSSDESFTSPLRTITIGTKANFESSVYGLSILAVRLKSRSTQKNASPTNPHRKQHCGSSVRSTAGRAKFSALRPRPQRHYRKRLWRTLRVQGRVRSSRT
jgi:hypothetical protein